MRLTGNGDWSPSRNEAAVRPESQLQALYASADLFPGSQQVRIVGLAEATDRAIWEYAKANGFAIASLDADFADMAALVGAPPKLVWLRCGNQPSVRRKNGNR